MLFVLSSIDVKLEWTNRLLGLRCKIFSRVERATPREMRMRNWVRPRQRDCCVLLAFAAF
jgi:hypothetical protein